MEQLFRFFVIRPPGQVKPEKVLELEDSTDFIDALRGALAHQDPRAEVREVTLRFVAEGYADSLSKLQTANELVKLEELLQAAGPTRELGRSDVATAVRAAFGLTPEQVAGSEAFSHDRQAVSDAIVAIKLLPSENSKPLVDLARAFRLLSLVERLVKDEADLDAEGAVEGALTALIQMPEDIYPLPSKALPQRLRPERPEGQESGEGRLEAAREREAQLASAIAELMSLPPKAVSQDEASARSGGPESDAQGGLLDGLARFLTRLVGGGRTSASDTTVGAEHQFVLTSAAVSDLSSSTSEMLQSASLNATAVPLDRLVTTLNAELEKQSATIVQLEESPSVRTVRLGSGLILYPLHPPPAEPAQPVDAPSVPSTIGSVKDAGVADLLVVRQEVRSYQAREVAHIENVLKGELKARRHRRSTTTEDFTLRETETVTEEERELASTERFELQRAVEETIKEDAQMEGGVQVSGKWGPNVDYEAYVKGSSSRSKEGSVALASAYASEVTSRAASKVTQRFMEQTSRRIVREVEEINRHDLNNVDGDDHIAGIYQWVEKTCQAQVFNYGERSLYDFMVPVPASFFVSALGSAPSAPDELKVVEEFTVQPPEIKPTDYQRHIHTYGVSGVNPPPEEFVTVAKSFGERAKKKDNGPHIEAMELPIPPGYEAMQVTALIWKWHHAGKNWELVVQTGHARMVFQPDKPISFTANLQGQTGTVPLTIQARFLYGFVVGVEIKCRRTKHALQKWQNDTHAAIYEAYRKEQREYEEKLAGQQIEMGVEISGRHPQANRALERDELKRSCITLLTAQHFDLFDAIETGSHGHPQINLTEAQAEGPYIRFFEQAFEWENIAYVFYPYFWGRKEHWTDRLSYEDADPLFEAFLKAGAARVMVPVRPGFEDAIDHFMSTGKPWQGGEMAGVNSKSYLPIVEEIRAQTGAPGHEVPEGDPWDVTLPTTLVYLRPQPTLPSWEQDEDGRWVQSDTR
jgi:hypothetical protein